jgi:CheY-like chemotaxis protein
VLIIDDEAIVVTVASGILRRRGFAVLSASSGGSGLALYRQHAPAISAILLDLTMPGMDGAEVFSALLDSGCRAPVIFSSGYAEHEVQSRLAGASPAGVIQKPYSGDELLAVVERVLAPA